MAWVVVEKPQSLKMTKALAKEFAEMQAPPHDRPLGERRLATYRKAIENGTFRPPAWAKCFCSEDGKTYRVNGKHTSIMFSGMEKIPDNMFVTIESYMADSIEDVARLYATFDARSQVRTVGDINHCFAQSIPELKSVGVKELNTIVSALAFVQFGVDSSHVKTPAERAELLFDNVKLALWLFEVGPCKGDGKLLCRSPVYAAMAMTWKRSQSAATEFWTAVRDATGESPNLPDRVLNKYLSMMSVGFGRGAATTSSRKADSREFLVKCIHAWNAWRTNSKTDLRYSPSAKIPTVK